MYRKIIAIIFILICTSIHAFETERIINFHSDIKIQKSGRMVVTETIKVYGGKYKIKRGIVRVIPMYRTDNTGRKHKMTFKVLEVLRDGDKESFKVEKYDDDWEIYIGSSYKYLKEGVYEYVIKYETKGHVGFFENFDEIYWNVTGNDWEFDIEKASATIHLPDSAEVISTDCYTGRYGSTDTNCTSEIIGNTVYFKSTEVLTYKNGITVVAAFTRDVIQRPGALEMFWKKYRTLNIAAILLVVLLLYYFFTLKKAGIYPDKPVVVPTFDPPHDWSPAVSRYLYTKGYDNKTFTAAIVNLAVKGAIKIEMVSKKYHLNKTGKITGLSEEEKRIYDIIFEGRESITVANNNHSVFSSAYYKLSSTLRNMHNLNDYASPNSANYIWGSIGMSFLIGYIFSIWIGEEIATKYTLNYIIAVIFYLILFILFIINTLLLNTVTNPKREKLTAEFKGFRMYLRTAEENRLNLLTPPERTPELFEKLLPYAIAMNLENEWGEKFNKALKKINYKPQWFTDTQTIDYAAFATVLSTSLGSSLQNAQIDPTPRTYSSSDDDSYSSGSSSSSSSSSSGYTSPTSSSGSSSWSSGSSSGGSSSRGSSGGGGGGGGGRGW